MKNVKKKKWRKCTNIRQQDVPPTPIIWPVFLADLRLKRHGVDHSHFHKYIHTINSQVSATIGIRQILVDNREWRIIERGGESRGSELRKSVQMFLMSDSESCLVCTSLSAERRIIKLVDNWPIIERSFYTPLRRVSRMRRREHMAASWASPWRHFPSAWTFRRNSRRCACSDRVIRSDNFITSQFHYVIISLRHIQPLQYWVRWKKNNEVWKRSEQEWRDRFEGRIVMEWWRRTWTPKPNSFILNNGIWTFKSASGSYRAS